MVSSPAGVNPTKIVRPRAETGFTIHLHQKAQPWTRFGLLPLGPRSRPPHVMVTAGSGSARSPRPAPSAPGFRRDFRGQLLRGLRRYRPSGHALAPVPVAAPSHSHKRGHRPGKIPPRYGGHRIRRPNPSGDAALIGLFMFPVDCVQTRGPLFREPVPLEAAGWFSGDGHFDQAHSQGGQQIGAGKMFIVLDPHEVLQPAALLFTLQHSQQACDFRGDHSDRLRMHRYWVKPEFGPIFHPSTSSWHLRTDKRFPPARGLGQNKFSAIPRPPI